MTNAAHVGTNVQSTTSVVCTAKVYSIQVYNFVTRTKSNGTVYIGQVATKSCLDTKSCNVTGKLTYVSDPTDLWHGWGDGTVWFVSPQQGGKPCQFNGPWVTPVGSPGWYRSKQCKPLGPTHHGFAKACTG